MCDRAIGFLIASQDGRDGSWPVQIFPKTFDQYRTAEFQAGKVAVTGLALLALMGEGILWTPDPMGRKHPSGERVLKGVRWLMEQQRPESGHFGSTGADLQNFFNGHAIATWAMVEAAAMSGDADMRKSAEAGVKLLLSTQSAQGGWDYFGKTEPVSGTAYMSVWPLLALSAAREAGHEVPELALRKGAKFYESLTRPDGRVLYAASVPDDNQDRPNLNAIGYFVQAHFGSNPRAPLVQALAGRTQQGMVKTIPEWGTGWIPNRKPTNDDDKRAFVEPLVFLFGTYGAYARGGEEWNEWYANWNQSLGHMQDSRDGAFKLNDAFTRFGGTVYSTALCALSMQVYYRQPFAALPALKGED
jgi:hypothetical protein